MSQSAIKGSAFYQIYPRSFCDTNKDGIGDLNGITQKLDYVASLGVDGIWISPFFTSPMKDFGYDVSDYRDIDPIFGTLADFDSLLDKAHDLNLKIIIDLVLSHTSDQHPWFTGKPEYYVWENPKIELSSRRKPGSHKHSNQIPDQVRDDVKGQKPNNWVSVFGGPAWTWHDGRGQYYLHNFLPQQPDLNFHNQDVQNEALDIAKFWLERGVDGFRLDVVNFYFHDQQLRDNPPRDESMGAATQFEGDDPYSQQHHVFDKSRPENLDFLRRFQSLCDQYSAFTIGEIGDDHPDERSAEYTAPGLLNTCYNTGMMAGAHKKLTADIIREPIESFYDSVKKQSSLPHGDGVRGRGHSGHPHPNPQGAGCPAWAFSNHDVVRAASRWLADSDGFSHDPKLSKMLIALLGCLPGCLFLYQGEELGLPEAKLAFEDLQDPWGKHLYPAWQGRDGCRTPMPWTDQKPLNSWLPMPDAHVPLNIEKQNKDENSTLNFTRRFLAWRKTQDPLLWGNITFGDRKETTLTFTRRYKDRETQCHFDLKTYDFSVSGFSSKGGSPSD